MLWLVVVTSTVRLDRLAGRVLVLGACSLSWPLCNHPDVNLHSGVPFRLCQGIHSCNLSLLFFFQQRRGPRCSRGSWFKPLLSCAVLLACNKASKVDLQSKTPCIAQRCRPFKFLWLATSLLVLIDCCNCFSSCCLISMPPFFSSLQLSKLQYRSSRSLLTYHSIDRFEQ